VPPALRGPAAARRRRGLVRALCAVGGPAAGAARPPVRHHRVLPPLHRRALHGAHPRLGAAGASCSTRWICTTCASSAWPSSRTRPP
jgi:hypothetical protein